MITLEAQIEQFFHSFFLIIPFLLLSLVLLLLNKTVISRWGSARGRKIFKIILNGSWIAVLLLSLAIFIVFILKMIYPGCPPGSIC